MRQVKPFFTKVLLQFVQSGRLLVLYLEQVQTAFSPHNTLDETMLLSTFIYYYYLFVWLVTSDENVISDVCVIYVFLVFLAQKYFLNAINELTTNPFLC